MGEKDKDAGKFRLCYVKFVKNENKTHAFQSNKWIKWWGRYEEIKKTQSNGSRENN